MNVIAHLFAFVTENAIWPANDTAFHQIGKETVQLCSCMRWSGQATASETSGRHSKIAAVFLNQDIGGDLRSTEKRMFRRVDAHCFRNALLISMTGLDFPTRLQFAQRQAIGSVAIDFIRGRENKR